jgi:hypothetical protein
MRSEKLQNDNERNGNVLLNAIWYTPFATLETSVSSFVKCHVSMMLLKVVEKNSATFSIHFYIFCAVLCENYLLCFLSFDAKLPSEFFEIEHICYNVVNNVLFRIVFFPRRNNCKTIKSFFKESGGKRKVSMYLLHNTTTYAFNAV